MKFKVCTVWYHNNPSKIASEYPCVNDFGFSHEAVSEIREFRKRSTRELVTETYTYDQPYVTINSLEDLLKFTKDVEHPIIISLDEDIPEIEIYDDYRE